MLSDRADTFLLGARPGTSDDSPFGVPSGDLIRTFLFLGDKYKDRRGLVSMLFCLVSVLFALDSKARGFGNMKP